MRYQAGTKGSTDGYGGIGIEPPHKPNHPRRQPRGNRFPSVTLENLKTARAHNGIYNPVLRCVEYKRTEA